MKGQLKHSLRELLVNKIFIYNGIENKEGMIEFFTFIQIIKKQLSGANQMIKMYFREKFLLKDIKVRKNNILQNLQYTPPVLSSPSYILNEDWLFQLFLAAPETKLLGCNKLTLLFSNLLHPEGFPKLVKSITESNLPTLILIQHQDQYVQVHDRSAVYKSNIFGAVSNERWYNTAQSNGTENDCLFSLYPEFRVIFSKKTKNAKQDFRYLNYELNKQMPNGIGFGGIGSEFRLWIDEDYENKSYIRAEDNTYESGHLIQPHIKELKINLIEVWALQKPATQVDQEDEKFVKIDAKDPLLPMNQTTGQGDFYWLNEAKPNFYWMQSSSSDEENENDQPAQNLNEENNEKPKNNEVKISKDFEPNNGQTMNEEPSNQNPSYFSDKKENDKINQEEQLQQKSQLNGYESQKKERIKRNVKEERFRFSDNKKKMEIPLEDQQNQRNFSRQTINIFLKFKKKKWAQVLQLKEKQIRKLLGSFGEIFKLIKCIRKLSSLN